MTAEGVASVTNDGEPLVATVEIDGPFDLGMTLSPLLRGHGDPTMRLERGRAWRATRTPLGPATLAIERTPTGVSARAWGSGAGWALDRLPALVGRDDDPGALMTTDALVGHLHRRHAGLRIGRTDAIFEALLPAILEQKVTGGQARRGFRGLVAALGERAPGPIGLRLPPEPEALARLPYHAFHPFGIERRRADTIRVAAHEASRLEALVDRPLDEASRRLCALPGIGPWTTAEVLARALGDVDAVSVGDFHLKHVVSWALAREPRGTDERMLELLEPYRGQRGRVVRLLEASGVRPPAYGPRLALRRIERD